jgi:hypothetical protein
MPPRSTLPNKMASSLLFLACIGIMIPSTARVVYGRHVMTGGSGSVVVAGWRVCEAVCLGWHEEGEERRAGRLQRAVREGGDLQLAAWCCGTTCLVPFTTPIPRKPPPFAAESVLLHLSRAIAIILVAMCAAACLPACLPASPVS